jgi:hypothetical protein
MFFSCSGSGFQRSEKQSSFQIMRLHNRHYYKKATDKTHHVPVHGNGKG